MRKLILSLTCLLLLTEVFGQRFYAGVTGTDYCFPAGRYTLYYVSSVSSPYYINGNYGVGLNVGLIAGYKISDSFQAEIQGSWFRSSELIASYGGSPPSFYYPNEKFSHQLKSYRIQPSVLYYLVWDKLKLFGRVGMSIGIRNQLFRKDQYSMYNMEYVTTGGIAMGFCGGTGISYKVNRLLEIRTELMGVFMNWSPKKSTCIRYVEDGVNKLDNLKANQKETIYKDQFDGSNVVNQDEPSVQLRPRFPIHAVGFQTSFVFWF